MTPIVSGNFTSSSEVKPTSDTSPGNAGWCWGGRLFIWLGKQQQQQQHQHQHQQQQQQQQQQHQQQQQQQQQQQETTTRTTRTRNDKDNDNHRFGKDQAKLEFTRLFLFRENQVTEAFCRLSSLSTFGDIPLTNPKHPNPS